MSGNKKRPLHSGFAHARLLFAAVFAAAIVAGCASAGTGRLQATDPQDEWGIRILRVTQTAAGHMVDLRYEVDKPEKAKVLLNPKTVAYLYNERTGKAFEVPKTAKAGRLQTTTNPPERGTVYFILFSTNGGVQPGDKVTLVIGDVRFEGLTVQE